MNRAMSRKLMIDQLQRKIEKDKPKELTKEERELCNEFVRLMKLEMLDTYEDDELKLAGFSEEDWNIDLEAEWIRLQEKHDRLFREA